MVQSIDDARRRQRGVRGRVPPHNLEAEESLLGAMLLSQDAVAAAIEMVTAGSFYKPNHGHIFQTILSLFAEGEPVDPVTVAERLRRADLHDQVGGLPELLSLEARTPATTNAARYARIVEEHALLRRLIGVGGEIAEIGYDLPEDVAEALDRAESLVFEVAERRQADSLVDFDQALHQSLDELEARSESPAGVVGTPTGYVDLDELLLGLHPSELYVVAARPGQGKTAFALGAAAHVATVVRKPVVFFSLEMSRPMLMQRVLSAESRVPGQAIRSGRLGDGDWPRISHALGRLAGAPMSIDDNAHCTVMEMRARCRRARARYGELGLVVVDYLQLMASNGRAENRQVEVAQFSRGLKLLARDLEAPVLALSQLSRNVEYRQDKRPTLADLRESGAIEADSDVVAFIFRDDQYNPDSSDRGVAEIIVAKHRNGPTRTVKLGFLGECTRFVNLARPNEPTAAGREA
jgi:replicative DNA helicase